MKSARSTLAPGLPAWSRWTLALLPLRDDRAEVLSDFTELFADRSARYGGWYAHRRLCADIVSLWRGTPRGGHVFQDLRFGLRLFGKHPLPVGLAIAGLALAIGAVTAAFSIVNATRLRPFAMDDPSTVIQITRSRFEGRLFDPSWPYARFLDMRAATSMSSVEAAMPDSARLSATALGDAGPIRPVLFVSGGYLETLGGRAALGRSLRPADDLPSAPPVAVIAHELWVSRFESRPDAIGSTLWLDGAPATIVGVMQPAFTGPVTTKPAAWLPFAAFDDVLGVAETYTINGRTPESMSGEPFAPSSRTLVTVVARLAPGVGMAVAEAEIGAIVNSDAGGRASNGMPTVVRVYSAASPIAGPRAGESYLEIAAILGLVGLVLAVACANTANLLLAAAATRTREIGVRLALGASTRRLLAQMVSESLMLGLAAGALGFAFAWWLTPLLGVMLGVESGVNLAPDARVLVFTIAVAVLCGLGAGIAPARFGVRGNLLASLQSQGGAAGRAPVPSRLRTSFIVLQAAVSMLLLVGGALLARTAWHMTRLDPGFEAAHLLAAEVTTPEAGFDEPGYFRRAVEAVRALPSVEHVGLIERRPFGRSIETVRGNDDRDSYRVYMNRSDAEFFRAAGVRLLRGRFFTDGDVAAEAPVALISDSVARRFFHGMDPIGQPLSVLPVSDEDESATIVGVVAEALLHRAHAEAFGMIHRPLPPAVAAGARNRTMPPTLIVRSTNPGSAARNVERALRRLDSRVRPATWIVQQDIDAFVGDKRMLAWLAAPLAGLALVLAAFGVYGVTAFVASRRTQEVSVRMALGASPFDVLRLLVGDGLRPVAIGLGIGLAMALGAATFLASLFTGIGPHDPVAIGAAAATLLGSATIAVLIPARRAARVDPASILRES